jgi:hypothetical protein
MSDTTYILLTYKAYNQDKVSETPTTYIRDTHTRYICGTHMQDEDADKEGKTSNRAEGKAIRHIAQPRYTMTIRVREKQAYYLKETLRLITLRCIWCKGYKLFPI